MTTFLVKCPNPQCNLAGEIPEQYMGRRVRCKQCGQAFILQVSCAGKDTAPASIAPEQVLRAWQPGEIILDNYRVERALGEGSLGTVYLLSRKLTAEERFAVKQVTLAEPARLRIFAQVLQASLDLPAHPNLASCRFYRAVDGGLLLFTEYVDGAPLDEWIAQRKLNRLPDILDVAVQLAWGLHAAHEQGYVHTRVKPGNVLLTPERVVKVCDAWLALATMTGPKAMTTDYCSPEQASGQRLSRATDVWSWAVYVLEMFTGEVAWLNGSLAGDTLEGFLAYRPDDLDLPVMPQTLAELLRLCFRQDPKTRPPLPSIAEALTRIYKKETGEPYPRPLPAFPRRMGQTILSGERRTEPNIWLQRAVLSAGRDPAEAETIIQAWLGIVAEPELLIFDQACTLYEELLRSGRNDLEKKFASLCLEAAAAHEQAEDADGALPLYEMSLPIIERLWQQEKHRELEPVLAAIYQKKGMAVQQHHPAEAVSLFDRCLAIRELHVHQEGKHALEPELSLVYFHKAIALEQQGDAEGAVNQFDRCIDLYARQVQEEGHYEYAARLADACLHKSTLLKALDDAEGMDSLYAHCIPLLERLISEQNRHEVAAVLATLYLQQGSMLESLDDAEDALGLYDRCIAIREQVLQRDERHELEPELASVYMIKADLLQSLDESARAIDFYDRCIALYEQLLKMQDGSSSSLTWPWPI